MTFLAKGHMDLKRARRKPRTSTFSILYSVQRLIGGLEPCASGIAVGVQQSLPALSVHHITSPVLQGHEIAHCRDDPRGQGSPELKPRFRPAHRNACRTQLRQPPQGGADAAHTSGA